MTWGYDEDRNNYRQCVLVRGTTSRTSWLPEQFCKVGQVVSLKEATWCSAWQWLHGWEVREVGREVRDGEKIKFLSGQSIRAAGKGKTKPLPYQRRQDWWMYD